MLLTLYTINTLTLLLLSFKKTITKVYNFIDSRNFNNTDCVLLACINNVFTLLESHNEAEQS